MRWCSHCFEPVVWSDTFARWCHYAPDGLPTWSTDHDIIPVESRPSALARTVRLGRLLKILR